MKIYLKGLNSCPMRKQKLEHYARYLTGNSHEIVADPEQGEAILVWTCAFREDVLTNSLRELDRYQRGYKAQVFALGCLPDIAPLTGRSGGMPPQG